MMSFFKFLDAYTLRARLFPAVIAAAPALAAVALLISWERIALSNLIATGALLVLLFALADYARRQGLRIEPTIYREMGGKPSISMMRRSADGTFDETTRERYRAFLARSIGRPAPSAQEEADDQARADAFYEQCGIWMRSNTRDAKKFPILFNELITYGFRRNLLGLKWPALTLNVVVVAVSCGLLWHRGIWDMTNDLTMRVVVVLLVATIHALYIALVVTKDSVKDAARKYARELILSCEAFLGTKGTSSRRGRATGGMTTA